MTYAAQFENAFWKPTYGVIPTKKDEADIMLFEIDYAISKGSKTLLDFLVVQNNFGSIPFGESYPELYSGSPISKNSKFSPVYGNNIYSDANHGVLHLIAEAPHTFSGESDIIPVESVIRGISLRIDDPELDMEAKYKPAESITQIQNNMSSMREFFKNSFFKIHSTPRAIEYKYDIPHKLNDFGNLSLEESPYLLKLIATARYVDDKILDLHNKRIGELRGYEMCSIPISHFQLSIKEKQHVNQLVDYNTVNNTNITITSLPRSAQKIQDYIEALKDSSRKL